MRKGRPASRSATIPPSIEHCTPRGRRDFSTSFALKLMLKDAGLIEKFSESLRSPIPALRIVEKNLASAVIKALEKEAGVKVQGT
jgi:glyoxylate/succinic semialdehyde reductase